MAACLYCGKRIDSDYLIWKGGASQAICEECQSEEKLVSPHCCRNRATGSSYLNELYTNQSETTHLK